MKSHSFIVLSSLALLASACVSSPDSDDMPAEITNLSGLDIEIESAQTQIAANSGASLSADHYLFPPNASPHGKSYEDLAAEWWQWSLSIPKSENPMLNGPCEENQSGDFFFLAGTTGGSAVRSCTIPAGKKIFFPIVNSVYWSCPEYVSPNGSYTCDMAASEQLLHDWAAGSIDNSDVTLGLEIDGVAVEGLEDFRAHTETFLDTSPSEWNDRIWPFCTGPIRQNLCGMPEGSQRNSVGDGFWAMMKPLPAGSHQIHFTALMVRANGSVFALDVTYNIDVTP